jgi:protein neuralized
MGQGQSNPNGSTFYAFGGGATAPHHSTQPTLKFNNRHGDNCQILREGSQAKRGDSFCKGIVFSDRPVEVAALHCTALHCTALQVGERVCIRLTELSIRWSGVLRLGFTAHNPANIQTLPKYYSQPS